MSAAMPPKTCPECGAELVWVNGDLACATLSPRETRAAKLEVLLRRKPHLNSLHALYRALPEWTRIEVFMALHDLRAAGVLSLRPLGTSDVAIRTGEGA